MNFSTRDVTVTWMTRLLLHPRFILVANVKFRESLIFRRIEPVGGRHRQNNIKKPSARESPGDGKKIVRLSLGALS